MVEVKSEGCLCWVVCHILVDRTNRLACAILWKCVIVHCYSTRVNPIENDVSLGLCKRAAPVYEVVLRHRHAVVENNFFNLCKIYRAYITVHLEFFHELGDIVCTIAGVDILHDDLTCYRQLGIERNLWISAVAADTSALVKNLPYLLVLRKVC